MALSTVYAGTTARVQTTFRDAAGALADPATTTLLVERPDGVVETVAGGFGHPSTGVYTYDYAFALPGRYTMHWQSTGNPTVVDEAYVFVQRAEVSA